MVIYPAGSTQKLSWNKEAEIIQLDIKPELITQIQNQLSTSNVELIAQFCLRDSLSTMLIGVFFVPVSGFWLGLPPSIMLLWTSKTAKSKT